MISIVPGAGYLVRGRPIPELAIFKQSEFQSLFRNELFPIVGLAGQTLHFVRVRNPRELLSNLVSKDFSCDGLILV